MAKRPITLQSLLFGRRLGNREAEGRKIGWIEAVPAMGLDAIGSSSYGPEAALTVMMPLGVMAAAELAPITGFIVALLAILYLSYRQTVVAYPVNGGGYVVARENLGEYPALLAAAALIVDYLLNVAVGVSAGVGALVSALPVLQPWTLPVELLVLLGITLANLRGTGEAGWLFALPAYLFIACFVGIVGFGLGTMALGGRVEPVVPPPPIPAAATGLSLWLLVRAFASGCTAMTGVEAVSNGVGAFKEPVVRNAHLTLTIIVAVLAVLLIGISILVHAYSIGAMDQQQGGYQSVLSQLAAAVTGRGPIYYVAMASALGVLCLSANTSFVAFPRLCRLVAADGYLPEMFALPGRRLVFSFGIIFLAVAAGLLLIAFGGITDRLIPLFAIGAFATFTLSQAGMVAHWRKQQGRHTLRLGINAVGAAATGVALIVILVAKFTEGAWLTLLAIPLMILLLKIIHRYYADLAAELREDGQIVLDEVAPPTVVVIAKSWTRLSEKAIKFALTISPDVIAVHLVKLEGPDPDEGEKALRDQWEREVADPVAARGLKPPRLLLIPSPYRKLNEPLLRLLRQIDEETPGRTVAVLIPEIVREHWWQNLLHTRRARRLRSELLVHGGARLTVATVPWRLTHLGHRSDAGKARQPP